jgi:uncharacterized membrane-anchored protein
MLRRKGFLVIFLHDLIMIIIIKIIIMIIRKSVSVIDLFMIKYWNKKKIVV